MHVHRSRRLLAAIALWVAFGAAGESASAGWRPPVAGELKRAFDLGRDPFEGGRHRGVDLAAAAGDSVRAPCPGVVVVAGQVGTSGRVVTIRCGPWRVSQMPLGRVTVRRGEEVGRGAVIGTAAPSPGHAGLHLGVRRDGDRFGYVDPLRFLEPAHEPPPPVAGRRPPRLGPAPRGSPAPAPRGSPASAPAVSPRGLPAPGSSPAARAIAPWPAWAGLALVLAGVGVRVRGRARDTATRWDATWRRRSGDAPRATRSS